MCARRKLRTCNSFYKCPLFPYITTLQRPAGRWAAAFFPPLPTTAHRQVTAVQVEIFAEYIFLQLVTIKSFYLVWFEEI